MGPGGRVLGQWIEPGWAKLEDNSVSHCSMLCQSQSCIPVSVLSERQCPNPQVHSVIFSFPLLFNHPPTPLALPLFFLLALLTLTLWF